MSASLISVLPFLKSGLSPFMNDSANLGYFVMMLYVDAFLYLVLALYIEQVCPGRYGIPKKCCFICMKSTYKKGSFDEHDSEFDPKFKIEGENFETEPDDLPIGVQIKGIKLILWSLIK